MPQSIHAFAEKVALITNGTSRVGRAIALQLALQGAFVTVGYSDASVDEESALGELRSLGTLSAAVPVDISTAEGAKSLVDHVNNSYGRLDLLVNCERFSPETAFQDTGNDLFTGMIDRNLRSVFFITQAAVELMRDRPKARIVNIVSACDTAEISANSAFCMTQAAIMDLTRTLAASLPKKFRVNCVRVSDKGSPTAGAGSDLYELDKGVKADDVARVVVYLLSGEAVGVNGQILIVE